jgi:hypothetical protein
MLKDLIILANNLDSAGLTREANMVDHLLSKSAGWSDDEEGDEREAQSAILEEEEEDRPPKRDTRNIIKNIAVASFFDGYRPLPGFEIRRFNVLRLSNLLSIEKLKLILAEEKDVLSFLKEKFSEKRNTSFHLLYEKEISDLLNQIKEKRSLTRLSKDLDTSSTKLEKTTSIRKIEATIYFQNRFVEELDDIIYNRVIEEPEEIIEDEE